MDYSMRLVGLRILIDRAQNAPNVLTKSALKMNRSTRQRPPESGFLKVCYLCNKDLSPDKDVYMYRGDQGFCSVTCRQKQIAIDERRDRGVFKWDRPVPLNSPRCRKGERIQESGHRRRILAAA
ncbi:hypothetical protein QJS10_CPA09g00028 [Acorus calamus]|uniref:FLZ-type domain-containing protein n=1 Tax=Acorus calamus TaxID=4465 RepID=A0AAV9E595_ACOCL|nr:hypothetical protein QJS10_CPA09g00028 [Acorus calamus]